MTVTVWQPAIDLLVSSLVMVFAMVFLAFALAVWDKYVIDKLLRTLGIGCEFVVWIIDRRVRKTGCVWNFGAWRRK